MTTEFKLTETQEAWLQALESGRYYQTKETLHDKVGYCCLGVYCDLVNPQGWESGDAFSKVFAFRYVTDEHDYEEYYEYDLAGSLMSKLGLFSEGGGLECNSSIWPAYKKEPNKYCGSLAEMNDHGYTFAEIAAFIRANPAAVFNN